MADAAEAELLRLAVQWAVIHPAESIEEAETIVLRCSGDTGIPVAGPGAPLVAEFSIAEFAAAVGVGTEAGKRYVGHALELRYRLPRLWARVVSGDLAAWKARRVADQTLHLSLEAAGFVDRHVAPVAHKVKPAQIDRLVGEAIARFMPDQAEEDRRRAWDQRHFDVDFDAVGIAGTCPVIGEVDLADAIDLNHAVSTEAAHLAALGSTETLDQRRATALGVIARRDLVLDYPPPDRPPSPRPTQTDQPPAEEDQGARRGAARAPGRSHPPRHLLSATRRSGGWRTPGPRSRPRPSGSGAATPTRGSSSSRSGTWPNTSTSSSTRWPTGSASTSPCET